MAFLNTTSGEYPRHIGDLELLGWKQGEPLPEGWIEYETDPFPIVETGYKAVALEPVCEDGKWVQHWTVEPLTEEEVLAGRVAQVRRKVLSQIPLTTEEALLLTEPS